MREGGTSQAGTGPAGPPSLGRALPAGAAGGSRPGGAAAAGARGGGGDRRERRAALRRADAGPRSRRAALLPGPLVRGPVPARRRDRGRSRRSSRGFEAAGAPHSLRRRDDRGRRAFAVPVEASSDSPEWTAWDRMSMAHLADRARLHQRAAALVRGVRLPRRLRLLPGDDQRVGGRSGTSPRARRGRAVGTRATSPGPRATGGWWTQLARALGAGSCSAGCWSTRSARWRAAARSTRGTRSPDGRWASWRAG